MRRKEIQRNREVITGQNAGFTEGGILAQLFRFAMPVLFALLLQAMYGAADLLIVGQFGTAADVSAVSTGSQIMQTITSVVTGLSMGTTILLGQKIGQKKEEEAGNVIGGAIFIFSVLAVFITIVMVAAAVPFSAFMHAPKEAFDKTVEYVRICSAGSAFIVAYNVLGSIFRGMGDSKTPLYTVLAACAVNIVGDFLLVAVFRMAAAGAAIATVAAQSVSVVLCLLLVKKKGLLFRFTRRNLRFRKEVVAKTLRLGFPIALQDGLVSLSFLAIITIVNSLGVIPSAGVGVAEKLCVFIMLVPSSYMQSMSVFAAQNIGAGRNDRAVRAMVCGMLSSFVFGVVMSYLSFFHGEFLAGMFAKDADVAAAAADYLRAYAIDTLLVSFLFCFIGYFNGREKTTFVMVQGIVGAFLVRIPVSYIMSRTEHASLFRIGLATPASTVLQISLCLVYFFHINRRSKRTG
ncbi:MATE family efflux transporter [Lacrimispora sp. NSJ-141]|uniref:MATE family efflux transporter n=1 Tax=Lientehia hominis TaxID=2897778 RepID=A0AAP2RGM7_9FIRM|nr:MATE family efflux transporter [Lientehia hominis]MCD2491879.1 MATE family efflux transporter [Lientehia hominis]